MKRIICIVLVLILSLSLFACNKGNRDGDSQTDDVSKTLNPSASVKIKIVAANFGYGVDYLNAVARAYENQNKHVSITVTTTVLPHQVLSQIEGGLDTYDMFFGTVQLATSYNRGFMIALDDVYNSIPEGETKTVAQKMGVAASGYTFNGHYTGLPYINSPVGLLVNYTTLDELFGTGNYTLPQTTDELFTFCKAIRSAGAYSFCISTSDSYMQYAVETWWNQYDSESYNNYFAGKVVVDGQLVDAQQGESLTAPGKLEALKICEILCKKSNGYVHQYANSMNFAEAQAAYCGLGYGFVDQKLSVFSPNGAWFENEVGSILTDNPQDIKMIRFPVISSIINVVPDGSIADDAELSALISAIDAGSTSLSGTGYTVSQADFDYIKRARSIVDNNTAAMQCGITACSQNQEECKKFLTFYASDVAAKIIATKLSGLTTPFGYNPASDSTIVMSNFVRSVYNTIDGSIGVQPVLNSLLFLNGLQCIGSLSGYTSAFFNSTNTAARIYQDDITTYTREWPYLTAPINEGQ